jgi:hypothetical protein
MPPARPPPQLEQIVSAAPARSIYDIYICAFVAVLLLFVLPALSLKGLPALSFIPAICTHSLNRMQSCSR